MLPLWFIEKILMKKERKDDSFIKQPYYNGGEAALKDFLSKQLKYPETSKDNSIEGDVHIKYDIDYKGNVIDAKIISGLDKACNEEALRVVKLLKFVVPKNPRNLKVTFHKSIRIHFQMPKTTGLPPQNAPSESPAHLSIPLSYNFVPTVKPQPAEKNKISAVYNYTIPINKN